MRIANQAIIASLLSCMTLAAFAQTSIDRSFTTTAKNCDGVQWSQAALETYPKIASACQSVEERDGKSFVKFQGTVTANKDRGTEVTVKFKDAGEMTLTPPADTNVYVDGRRTSVANLQRGDELNFYIAEDRLAAQFYAQNETPVTTTRFIIIPIAYEEAAEMEQTAEALPATATQLAALAAGGALLLMVGVALTYRRRNARSR